MAANQKNQKTAEATGDVTQTRASEGQTLAAGSQKQTVTEAEYTVEELTAAAHRFGVRAECVRAALRVAGVQKATLQKAKEIIQQFMGREVR